MVSKNIFQSALFTKIDSAEILDSTGSQRLDYLPQLKYLDFRENKLTEDNLAYTFANKSLKKHPLEFLDLSGNEIEIIKLNIQSFPSLRTFICGSQQTKFISFSLLTAVSEHMVINVPEVYRDYLLIPIWKELAGGENTLKSLLDGTRLNLQRIRIASQRYHAYLWILTEKSGVFKELSLSQDKDFCQYKSISGFLKHPSLINISSLYLDNCRLDTIPFQKGDLVNLKLLDISENNIGEICTTLTSHQKLEKLYIDGNPIETIQIAKIKKNFPHLKYIQAGSENTKYIAMPVLEVVKDGKLTIDITKEFRTNLLLPPYEVLSGGSNSLHVYISDITSSEKSKTDVWKSTTQNILMFLGSPEAGKTSLKRTLEHNSPKVTLESDRTVILERTVIKLSEGISIAALDFGGHDIYELEYPIFLRGQNIIALIVVDLTTYNQNNHNELVTKWLHNCVLCADCKVIFVPTKTEQLPLAEVNKRVDMMKECISRWLKGEVQFLREATKHTRQKPNNNRDIRFPHKKQNSNNVETSLAFFRKFSNNNHTDKFRTDEGAG